MKITEIVEQAILLQRNIEVQQANLDGLKEQIRQQAKRDTTEGQKVTYACAKGKAEVVFVSDKTVLKPGVNMALVKRELGDETYSHLFEERVSVHLQSEFDSAVTLLPVDVRRRVAKIVEVKTSEPRVSLK
jgi:hypothetical protein